MKEEVSVAFVYGNLNIELRCWYNYNVRIHVLRAMIAWPLLMLAVVVFCVIAVYLVLKRMSTAERDVDEREKINVKLREAKIKAEAADPAKSSFLATVSHEIRHVLLPFLTTFLTPGPPLWGIYLSILTELLSLIHM